MKESVFLSCCMTSSRSFVSAPSWAGPAPDQKRSFLFLCLLGFCGPLQLGVYWHLIEHIHSPPLTTRPPSLVDGSKPEVVLLFCPVTQTSVAIVQTLSFAVQREILLYSGSTVLEIAQRHEPAMCWCSPAWPKHVPDNSTHARPNVVASRSLGHAPLSCRCIRTRTRKSPPVHPSVRSTLTFPPLPSPCFLLLSLPACPGGARGERGERREGVVGRECGGRCGGGRRRGEQFFFHILCLLPYSLSLFGLR